MTDSKENKIARATHIAAILRNKLVAGVLLAVPLVVTIWVLNLAYRFITGISAPFLRKIVLVAADPAHGVSHRTANEIPGVGFIVTLLLLLLLGFVGTHVFGKRVIAAAERLLLRIPVVATVYAAVKQIIDSFNVYGDVTAFKRVVYVDYPSEGCKLIGFVTGQFYDSHLQQDMMAVILPTSPNPMTGLLVVVPTSRITPSDLTLEEATKLVVSAGLVAPRRTQQPSRRVEAGQLSASR